jgi:hypothetical protein
LGYKMNRSTRMAQSIVGMSPGRPDGDFYPTPEIATRSLLKVENFDPVVWECACGDGAISKILWETYPVVESSDLFNHGYGETDVDFLQSKLPYGNIKSIITNPPFSLVGKFIQHAYDLNVDKFAFLCKLALLEGKTRSILLERTHLSRVWVFRKRLTLTRNGEPQRSSGMIAFAWFVWEKNWKNNPIIGWI